MGVDEKPPRRRPLRTAARNRAPHREPGRHRVRENSCRATSQPTKPGERRCDSNKERRANLATARRSDAKGKQCELRLSDRLALRPREAAEALGLSERSLRGLLPQLPVVRTRGAVLIPVEALRDWLLNTARSEGDNAKNVAQEVLQDLGVE